MNLLFSRKTRVLMSLCSLAFLGFGIWYLYRIIRGLVHALESKPY